MNRLNCLILGVVAMMAGTLAGCAHTHKLEISCANGPKCAAVGSPLTERKDTPTMKGPQGIRVGEALEEDVPPHPKEDHEIGPRHGKHCWVQLPGGTWQMYHC